MDVARRLFGIHWGDAWAITLKRCETFESTLSQWKVPVMGVLPIMPRCVLGNAGRHWIAVPTLGPTFRWCDSLGTIFVGQWVERFGLEEKRPATFRVSHGLFEQLLLQHAEQILPLRRDGVPRIFIPGDLRTKAEVNMVLDAIAHHQGHVQWVLAGGETFNGRRKPTYWRLNKLSKSHEVFCYQRRLSDHELVGEVLAADCVVVPRTRGLNSGIPFLAATLGSRSPCLGAATKPSMLWRWVAPCSTLTKGARAISNGCGSFGARPHSQTRRTLLASDGYCH